MQILRYNTYILNSKHKKLYLYFNFDYKLGSKTAHESVNTILYNIEVKRFCFTKMSLLERKY